MWFYPYFVRSLCGFYPYIKINVLRYLVGMLAKKLDINLSIHFIIIDLSKICQILQNLDKFYVKIQTNTISDNLHVIDNPCEWVYIHTQTILMCNYYLKSEFWILVRKICRGNCKTQPTLEIKELCLRTVDHYIGEFSMFMRGKIISLLGCKTYIL